MAVKLIVFDIIGTTIKDTGKSVNKALAEAMRAFGYIIPPNEIDQLLGYEKPLAIKKILLRHEDDPEEITDELVRKIHALFVKLMLAHYRNGLSMEALPGVEDTFTILHQKGIKIGLNTEFSREVAQVIIDR